MDAADEKMKTENPSGANNDKPLTYEQSGGYRFMAWPECSGNKDEHYEISVPELLKPKGITYRSALGDERTSKMAPDLAKAYNTLFHDVCVACAKVHREIEKPVWRDYLHPKHKKDSKETATVPTAPNASGTGDSFSSVSTVPKEDEKDEYKVKLEECKTKRLAAMKEDKGCKTMIDAFFKKLTAVPDNLVANERPPHYASLDNFTTHILSDADHVCGQTIGKHTVLASLVECEKSDLFMKWLEYVAQAYVMNSEGHQAMKNNVLSEDMDQITAATTLYLAWQADKLKRQANAGAGDKTALQFRLQQAREFGASNGVQVLRGEEDKLLNPESAAFVPSKHDNDSPEENVKRYSIFCTRKRDGEIDDVIEDGHFFNARRFAFEAKRFEGECQLILTNPTSAAAATAKNVAYDYHKELMEKSVSNKLIHLLLNHVKYSYESLKCGTVLRDTLEAQAFVDMHCFLFKLQDQAFSNSY
ncbi:hypothetical protein T484DRAFT_1758407, partial [Baffinella frigidus]